MIPKFIVMDIPEASFSDIISMRVLARLELILYTVAT